MKSESIRLIGLGIAGAVVLATGIWLTLGGRPYGGLPLNIHKLIALGAVVYIGVVAWQTHRAVPLAGSVWALLAAAAVLAVAAFASGGVVSAMASPPTVVLWLHRIGSWAAAAAMAASAWVLWR